MSAYVHSGSERLTTSDWFTSNYALSTDAERGCQASHDVRQEARYLRNETDNKTYWDQLDTNSRLADRVDNIRVLKDLLERTAAALEREISSLNEAKQNVECALDERVGLAVHVNVDNLVAREARRDGDIVEDVVEVELHKEKEVLESVKQQLQQKIHESFEHLCVLQDLRQTMLTDLQNKNITLDIDVDQYNTTTDSNGISFKPDPTRRPKQMLTVKQWDDYVRFNKARADKEMCNSVQLRESILDTLQQTSSDLLAQHTATAYGYRHRLHEYSMALDELYYRKKLTEEEMSDAENEIRRLQEAIAIKVGFSKVAQTRLETRLTRPHEEMCQDNVQYGLQDEVKQLGATTQSLQDKLRQQQHALHCLELNLHRLNEQIEIKLNSQHIDAQCLASRDKLLPIHPLTGARTDVNKQLVGIHRLREHVLPY